MNKGITKIEVLIVVIIILIIIIVNVVVISGLNNKTHDIQVLSEIKQVRSGLELFLLNNNYYPQSAEAVILGDVYQGTEKLCLAGFKKLNEVCQKNILNPVPSFYSTQDNLYRYKSLDNLNYQLEFNLKTNFKDQGLLKGIQCATNTGIVSQPCF